MTDLVRISPVTDPREGFMVIDGSRKPTEAVAAPKPGQAVVGLLFDRALSDEEVAAVHQQFMETGRIDATPADGKACIVVADPTAAASTADGPGATA